MKFRRKASAEAEDTTHDDQPVTGATLDPAARGTGGPGTGPVTGRRDHGPWDADEVDKNRLDPDQPHPNQVDLGSLVVPVTEGLDIQLQVDETTGTPIAVLLAGSSGAVELRVFAAPRNGNIWPDVAADIAAEVTRRGGTATEAEGEWGPELRVVITVTTPEGQTGTQPSRCLGIAGPRWLLRATLFGAPAVAPEEDGAVETALRQVIVRRGQEPYAPGDPLPLVMPAQATPVAPA